MDLQAAEKRVLVNSLHMLPPLHQKKGDLCKAVHCAKTHCTQAAVPSEQLTLQTGFKLS